MWVPEKYECTHGEFEMNSACSQNTLIPCWVSRPWEKTIFMLYMTIVSFYFFIILSRTARELQNLSDSQERCSDWSLQLII